MRAGWTMLPAVGRQGVVPDWPLAQPMANQVLIDEDGRQTIERVLDVVVETRELTIWAAEWKRPQAVQWERNGQELEVALYVRTLVAAEDPAAKANVRTLVKQQQEALGLSLPGLARLRWKIAAVAEKESSPARPARKTKFKVVEGGGEGNEA